jgi:lipopolysaccharide transport system permease protein
MNRAIGNHHPDEPQDPHAAPATSLWAAGVGIWLHWQLIGELTKREVVGRYRGSAIGLAWSFLNPLLMLAVYTFVFGFVFQSRWGGAPVQSQAHFSLILFVGLVIHAMFAECANRAPSLVLSNPNFVKKVRFPLEILPVVQVGASLFHLGASTAVLLVAMVLLGAPLHWSVLLLPLVLAPLAIGTLGLAWFLASIGVFIRDIGQTIGIATTVLLFLSPVFYPASALPERVRFLFAFNPLTVAIEQAREVVIWGHTPAWGDLGLYWLAALACAAAGFWWFQRTRKGFADVI